MNSEQTVKDFLSRYGLRSEKFNKNRVGNGRTPDFKVYKCADLLFYCEVKNAQEDIWLDKMIEMVPPGEIVGGERQPPVFNRLSKHIHQACKQFDGVNADLSKANVLAFYNEDRNSGFDDLIAIVTGNFYAKGGEVLPIYKKFSEGRMKNDIKRIHLFIWIDAFESHHFLFNTSEPKYQDKLYSVFNYNPQNSG